MRTSKLIAKYRKPYHCPTCGAWYREPMDALSCNHVPPKPPSKPARWERTPITKVEREPITEIIRPDGTVAGS